MPEDKKKEGVGKNHRDGSKEIHIDEELQEEEEKPEIRHLKTKPVPALIALFSTFIAAVYTFLQGIKGRDWLLIVLLTLVVFLVIGDVVKLLLDRIEIVVEKEEEETEAPGDEEGEDGEAPDEDE